MDPINGSLRAENIQPSRGVGELNKLNASVGRVDPRLGICAFRPVGRWSVPIGQLRADNDNPAVRRELQNVAMLDVESADYERRDRRQLRINAGCDRSLQQLGCFSPGLQSSFLPLRFAVAVALEPGRAGQRCPRRLRERRCRRARASRRICPHTHLHVSPHLDVERWFNILVIERTVNNRSK